MFHGVIQQIRLAQFFLRHGVDMSRINAQDCNVLLLLVAITQLVRQLLEVTVS